MDSLALCSTNIALSYFHKNILIIVIWSIFGLLFQTCTCCRTSHGAVVNADDLLLIFLFGLLPQGAIDDIIMAYYLICLTQTFTRFVQSFDELKNKNIKYYKKM
jgi:hypothetical protein